MTDDTASRDPAWYRDQWEKLMNMVGADSPADALSSVVHLRDRVDQLEQQASVLEEAGFDRPELALHAIESMEQQLDELYNEKEVTEQSDSEADLRDDADTFDQLQALLAREEKLQRELGVSNPDAVVEMVEGLTDQLEDLYIDRDESTEADSIFSPAPPDSGDGASPPPETDAAESGNALDLLERELGVSDPEAVVAMMDDLTNQLEELYTGRERLAELNLNGADDAIAMVRSMQQQLEVLYERQEEMSRHGIDGIDHALSMIESMEAQLTELYDEPPPSPDHEQPDYEEASARLEQLEEKLESLTEEKDRLRQKRDRLQQRFDDLEEQLGTGDPDAISSLVRSMELQLEEVYEKTEHTPYQTHTSDDAPLLDADTLARLSEMDDARLDALPVGLFCLDADGVVQRANEQALGWPDVTADAPDAFEGTRFFDDVAPGTNNALFRGQFDDGVAAGALDEQFFYTYVGKRAPLTNLVVRLYGAPDQSDYWIVFQVLDHYKG